jgi:hypothetical protein
MDVKEWKTERGKMRGSQSVAVMKPKISGRAPPPVQRSIAQSTQKASHAPIGK